LSILATNGGLWGDFTTIFWISKHLEHPIHVWNTNNGWILSKVRNEYNSETLHIVYGNNHFEVATMHNEIINVVNVDNCNVNNETTKFFETK
jgi:hypothetical protein